MKNLKIKLSALALLAILAIGMMVSSCKKDVNPLKEIQQLEKKVDDKSDIIDVEPSCWTCIKSVAEAVLHHMQGYKQYNTVGNTTTTWCSGFGTCEGKAVHNPNGLIGGNKDIGNNNIFTGSGDCEINCEFAVDFEDNIIFRIHQDENNYNMVFYAETIHFFSEPYLVDNEEFLQALGLTQAFTIAGGDYDVFYTPDGYANIIIGTVE